MTASATTTASPSPDYRRVEKAIRYLQSHHRRQPSLAEVARSVGVSEYHFQRLFRRWAGVSPKRFLQYLTAEHARGLLRESRSVLETAHEVGLSGGGRLHDLLVAVDAVTPGEVRRMGAGLEIRYGFHPSPFGEALLAATGRGVCGLSFVDGAGRAGAVAALRERWPLATLREDAAATDPVAARVFAPRPAAGPIPLLLQGTNFQLKVWEALLRVAPGEVTCYERLAAEAGAPGATRAVGTAVGRNPVAWLIPCHRVIRKSGALGGYRWGPERKGAMLGWEAARREAGVGA